MTTEDVRTEALRVLADAEPGFDVPRRVIANKVFGTDLVGAGATYAALGWLTQRGWVEECAYHRRNYRITDAGRVQLVAQTAMRAAVERAS